jgi:hypothetical protein
VNEGYQSIRLMFLYPHEKQKAAQMAAFKSLYGGETAPSREEPFQTPNYSLKRGISIKPKYRQWPSSGPTGDLMAKAEDMTE